MLCPICSVKMEGEDCPIAGGSSRINKITKKLEIIDTPHKHYRCDKCDIELVWTKGEKGLRVLGCPAIYEDILATKFGKFIDT